MNWIIKFISEIILVVVGILFMPFMLLFTFVCAIYFFIKMIGFYFDYCYEIIYGVSEEKTKETNIKSIKEEDN